MKITKKLIVFTAAQVLFSEIGVGNIYSHKFEYGKTVLGSRSPHVTMGNILLAQNVASENIDKYFNLTNEIVYINSIDAGLK